MYQLLLHSEPQAQLGAKNHHSLCDYLNTHHPTFIWKIINANNQLHALRRIPPSELSDAFPAFFFTDSFPEYIQIIHIIEIKYSNLASFNFRLCWFVQKKVQRTFNVMIQGAVAYSRQGLPSPCAKLVHGHIPEMRPDVQDDFGVIR